MDIGLDRLLVALEERFGKKPTDGFVLLLAAGIVVYVLRLIVVDGIEPLYQAINDASEGNVDWGELAGKIGLTAILAAAGVLASASFSWTVARFIGGRERKRIDAHVDEARASINEVIEDAQQLMSEAGTQVKEAQESRREATELLKNAQEMHERVERGIKEWTELQKDWAELQNKEPRRE